VKETVGGPEAGCLLNDRVAPRDHLTTAATRPISACSLAVPVPPTCNGPTSAPTRALGLLLRVVSATICCCGYSRVVFPVLVLQTRVSIQSGPVLLLNMP